MSAKRRTSSKSGLTLLLEELTTLLPKALEACPADFESQSSSLVIEKLRSVLLDLLDNCLKCSSGQGSRCRQQHAQHASLQLHVPAVMVGRSLPALPARAAELAIILHMFGHRLRIHMQQWHSVRHMNTSNANIQNSAVGALACCFPAGKHIVAVLKILKHVLDKLPATFPGHAHSQALACMVQLLGRLPAHQG
jgi:hypothetical protein